ncbi:hypothetical protein OAV84_02675 [Schleiferiaceae bacterium]|jgi:hypothetical protein|nr:hypothetical protein [Schleiferiaceae bacterium]MDC3353978.1 hypothetical protein [Schleiferiaceae bacterium]
MKRLLLALLVITFGLSACKKKDAPVYSFSVEVIDENGTPIQNAYVRATAPVVNAIPDFQGHTGIDGIMRNDSGDDVFEYTMPAVLQITAQKGDNPPVVFGCGYLKLEPDSTVVMKIVVLPYSNGTAGC